MGFKPGPETGGLQHGDRGLQERGGAQVGTLGIAFGHGRRGIDADYPEAGRAKCAGGGQAGNAAARDQDIGRFTHLGPPGGRNRLGRARLRVGR